MCPQLPNNERASRDPSLGRPRHHGRHTPARPSAMWHAAAKGAPVQTRRGACRARVNGAQRSFQPDSAVSTRRPAHVMAASCGRQKNRTPLGTHVGTAQRAARYWQPRDTRLVLAPGPRYVQVKSSALVCLSPSFPQSVSGSTLPGPRHGGSAWVLRSFQKPGSQLPSRHASPPASKLLNRHVHR